MPDAGPSLAEEETALYEVVPERFISARDALARRMRAAGDKAGAARVAKLRRPPLTTWALNQVARVTPELVEDLRAVGGESRAAMERALGGDASALRPARSAERAAVDAVVTAAATRLVQSGYSLNEVMRARMAETLRAAIVDESVAERLRAGTLERDHDAPGFGLDGSSLPMGTSKGAPPGPPEAAAPAAEPASGAPAGAVGAASSGETATGRPVDRDEVGERRDWDAQRREAERLAAEADRVAGEAEALAREADRLDAEAEQLAAKLSAARDLAAEARRRAGVAARVAAAARANADRAAAAT